jgi:NAD(P)-dependent dehydrogenase (short-subunit alcohol dehydrogenase family)
MNPRPLAIVTGANNGFGYSAAELLLQRGTDVILACRSEARGAAAAAALAKAHAGSACGTPTFMAIDLGDLASVASFAAAFLALNRPLALLIANAGIACLGARELTAQGFESTVGTNHLGHAALFNLLLPHLKASRTRVVAVGSMIHKNGAAPAGTPMDAASGWAAYANSKLLNSVWALEVQRRFAAEGVSANSVHPGAGLYTGLGPKGWGAWLLRATIVPLLTPLMWAVGFSQTWREGGVAELAAADAAEGGLYFHRHWVSQASEHARDAATGAWVWEETQRVLREAAAKHGLPAGIAAAE